jgi:hypothetical protein
VESKFEKFLSRLEDFNEDSRYTLEIDTMKTNLRAARSARDSFLEKDAPAASGPIEPS